MATQSMREDIAKKLIKQEAHWTVGGIENHLADCPEEFKPTTIEGLQVDIYYEVMSSKGLEVAGGIIPTKKDIRFLTRDHIMELIAQRLEIMRKHGDIDERILVQKAAARSIEIPVHSEEKDENGTYPIIGYRKEYVD